MGKQQKTEDPGDHDPYFEQYWSEEDELFYDLPKEEVELRSMLAACGLKSQEVWYMFVDINPERMEAELATIQALHNSECDCCTPVTLIDN